MSLKVDKFVKSYKSLSQIPAVVSGAIRSNGVINTKWTQRNLEKGKSTEFTKDFFTSNLKKIAECTPLDVSTETLSRLSHSEKLRAVLRDCDNKQFLEIWQQHNLIRSVDLNALDIHGPVYADRDFASFEWSPDEKKILYVAEKKKPKSDPFYKRKAPTTINESGDGSGEPKPIGQEYVYVQDWGEQLVGKKISILAQYDIENDVVDILEGVPENIFAAQPKYAPNGSYIVGVAYQLEPRKLGMVYCANRPSTIFHLDFEGNYGSVSLQGKSVKSPIFSPNGDYVLWLQRKSGGPHASAMQLVKTKLPLNENAVVDVVVDIVDHEKKIEDGVSFYGLFNTGFISRPWATRNRLIINADQKYKTCSYVIDISTGSITQLKIEGGSLRVLDVYEDIVLAVKRDFLKPDQLLIGKLGQEQESNIIWEPLTSTEILPNLEKCMYEYLDLKAPKGDVCDFNAIYIGPKSGNDKSVPLIVWPHGGPHSVFGTYLFLEEVMYLNHGFAMLLINYRGSLGSGQKSVEFLPSKIGDSDVQDCIQATDAALSKYPWLNPNKLALVGGSHGGFLVAHLSGQYPDKFKVVVARNPVIDIAAMSIISDIPDWCYVEIGKEYTQKGEIDNDALARMRQVSPINHAHKVKAPTLLLIGSKDLRVPPHQGTEHYYRLKSNGVVTKMLLYDDNHPLAKLPNEFDNLINSLIWIEDHLELEE
ncbi:acylamino-acid-releasing enzyme-like [Diorhabda sublineata]|uniref:acylamino-acid-releasing enzyme-like n=1 Tax=Diorhabda sublineata TaxID=1163346 RepID=UPI0024E06D28|nr:acylamino-acid-releasing enzyme-like [Diorhabda sublineata]XP_056638016.1 acylamino-acid-releasing enzyme-like [Diorhabda sublineata]XP_056638017.1 acylamino-acid-releasing enzyme-like [Diorhabda sublineata]XP_056638018.1 acylamino-acid-releasing enzyme-like [Diorhabda sublineata]XP_056638019.1 acylamino-acid-releasing enzyme-like [Diorhabda sublineata]XP_056638020.1 acylamino-acid-releasing enzyme-like [Diorhabda sublineata]